MPGLCLIHAWWPSLLSGYFENFLCLLKWELIKKSRLWADLPPAEAAAKYQSIVFSFLTFWFWQTQGIGYICLSKFQLFSSIRLNTLRNYLKALKGLLIAISLVHVKSFQRQRQKASSSKKNHTTYDTIFWHSFSCSLA